MPIIYINRLKKKTKKKTTRNVYDLYVRGTITALKTQTKHALHFVCYAMQHVCTQYVLFMILDVDTHLVYRDIMVSKI